MLAQHTCSIQTTWRCEGPSRMVQAKGEIQWQANHMGNHVMPTVVSAFRIAKPNRKESHTERPMDRHTGGGRTAGRWMNVPVCNATQQAIAQAADASALTSRHRERSYRGMLYARHAAAYVTCNMQHATSMKQACNLLRLEALWSHPPNIHALPIKVLASVVRL